MALPPLAMALHGFASSSHGFASVSLENHLPGHFLAIKSIDC
jgi:hypothetical protein